MKRVLLAALVPLLGCTHAPKRDVSSLVQLEGDSIVLMLRAGGEIVCPQDLVVRIAPDEVPYPEPEELAATAEKMAHVWLDHPGPPNWNGFWHDLEHLFTANSDVLKGKKLILPSDQRETCFREIKTRRIQNRRKDFGGSRQGLVAGPPTH